MRAPRIVIVICAAALLALPAVAGAQGQAAVTGEVFFLEFIALPPTATVNVQLQDVSLADAPATVIAEQTIPGDQGPPYAFSLPYDPAQIQDNRTYAVRATISDGDQLLFTSTEFIPAITRGGPTSGIQIRVVRVGGDPSTGTPPSTGGDASTGAPSTLPATGGAGDGAAALLALASLAVAGGLLARRRSA